MQITSLRVKNLNADYPVIIGKNILHKIPEKIKLLCPNAKKIALVVDKNVPTKFKNKLKKNLKGYDVHLFE